MMIQEQDRDGIVAEIRDLMAENYRGPQSQGACLYWAKATCEVLGQFGVRCIPQAGTGGWLRIDDADDDGKCDNAFCYEFNSDNPENVKRLAARGMPEMHVWAAIPEDNEIIDLTTGFQVQQCRETAGMDWPGAHPPEYIWTKADHVKRAIYVPDLTACAMVFRMLDDSPWGG